MSNTEQCSNCRFWFDQECRRYAPSPGATGSEIGWPITSSLDWCGEHEPIEEERPNETLDESRPAEDDGAL